MKPNRFERSYRDTVAPKDGLQRVLSNKTKLSKSAGKIVVGCDNCGTLFHRAQSQMKYNNHFCGVGCAAAYRRIVEKRTCIICLEVFCTKPSTRKRTCSKRCNSELWRRYMMEHVNNMKESSIFNYGNHERGQHIGPHSGLNEEKVRAIRDDKRAQHIVAAEYGIAQTTVSKIKRRKLWGYLT